MLAHVRRSRLWWAVALCLSLILLANLAIYYWLLADLPSLGSLHDRSLYGYAAAPSSKIYDRWGRLLYEMPPPHSGRHSPVPLNEMPKALRQAIVATEDGSYYQNPGVDAWAIVRALWINLQGGEILSGGSTITQQLARNLLMSPGERYERTLRRKMREAVLAWQIARRHTKDEILELYLNEIYFGNMAYGVEAAAQAYFGKHVRDLDLAECSMLAGLPQSPALHNPLENLEGAKARQAVVLNLMVKQGYLAASEAGMAQEEKLYFASAPFDIHAPHFVMYVRGLLEQELGLERLEQGGLEIYTTLDLDLNEAARDIVRHRLAGLAKCQAIADVGSRQIDCPPGGHNVRNAALVALSPQTGEILAMVGSPDYFSAEIDGAVNGATALRQPGSSIKPITYAAALGQGELTPATMMLDVRTAFVTREGMPYVPLNYDLQFRGPVRLREALASSYNLVAVKVLDSIGVEAMTSLARQLGITTFDDPNRLGLAVTLGGGEVRLLELTTAYATFANGGHEVKPVAILSVEDAKGHLLLAAPPSVATGGGAQILDERVAYLISDILSDEAARFPSFGEASALELTRPAAAKTGTTTDFRDNWTIGYTPELVAGVWAGNSDNSPMLDVSGISGAAPIWHDFMEEALKGQPVRDFHQPGGLVETEICTLSGLLAEHDCPHKMTEYFLEGTEPTEPCTMHQEFAIDRATGLQATEDTPPERIVERVFAILPAEAQDWARAQGIPQPPPGSDSGSWLANTGTSTTGPGSSDPSLALIMTSPDEGTVYRLDPSLPRDAQRISVSARPGTGPALAHVTLVVDGQPLAQFGAPPYQALWRLEPGVHLFTAEGVTGNGELVASDRVLVEVRE
jgi:1A family penicillin-binding protein